MDDDDAERGALNFTCSHNSSLSTHLSSKVLAFLSNQTSQAMLKPIHLEKMLEFPLISPRVLINQQKNRATSGGEIQSSSAPSSPYTK